MSEQQKIDIITQFLGREVNVDNNSITMSQELVDFLGHAELFKYYGVCTTGYSSEKEYGKAILDVVDWISEDICNDEMYKNIVKQLSGLYGETNIDENVSDDLQGEYVWRNVDGYSFIICGKNSDEKLNIRWINDSDFDSSKNDEQKSAEEIKMYTEYEGKYDEKASVYEKYAEECFWEEFESSKQLYVDCGGILGVNVDSDWYLSATFEYDNNYYFCYNYSYGQGGARSHILVKYDVKLQYASVETPLDWLEADINAAEAEIDN